MGLDDPNEMGYWPTMTPRELLRRVNPTRRSVNRTMAMVGALLGGVAVGALGYARALWLIIAVFAAAALAITASPYRGARL